MIITNLIITLIIGYFVGMICGVLVMAFMIGAFRNDETSEVDK